MTLPAHAGLCSSCIHAQPVTSSRGAVFVMCQLSRTDPAFPRYPTLPVLACRGYVEALQAGAGFSSTHSGRWSEM
jgi:hypothetical protein